MTRFNTFTDYLRLDLLQIYCKEHGDLVSYSKGDSIVDEGSVCRHLGIVTSGYFKFVTINSRGEECVTGFAFPGEVATDFVSSFQFNTPALTSIIAGCDSTAMIVPISLVKEYMAVHDSDFISHSTSVLLREGYIRYLTLYRKTAAERYAELLDRIGRDIDKISLKELASYLNVSRRQFHRIRDNF